MEKIIVIGKIMAPHGIQGELRIKPLTDNPKQFLDLKTLTLSNGKTLTVKGVRFHKNFVLVSCLELNTMNDVEPLRGLEIKINSEDLPVLKKDHYYVADLIGFDVYDEDNNCIGKLRDVIATGSTDVFAIKGEAKKDILIPALKVNIPNVDLKNKKINVVLPKWNN